MSQFFGEILIGDAGSTGFCSLGKGGWVGVSET